MQSLTQLSFYSHFSGVELLFQMWWVFLVSYILDCMEPVFIVGHKKLRSAELHSLSAGRYSSFHRIHSGELPLF